MIARSTVAAAALLFASPALAATVNVTTTTHSLYSDRISEVEVSGVGTHVFADPLAAPELTQQSLALELAIAGLGLPIDTVATIQGTQSIGSDETESRIMTSNYNPVDDPDFVVGDPEDCLTWIAVGDEDVNCDIDVTTTYYTFYRLLAELPAECQPGSFSADGHEPCTPCSAGTFSTVAAATECQDCTAGYFAADAGSTMCTACGAGTFELDLGSTACDACPGGQATPCNDHGVCSDGPTGNGICSCNVGYSGLACENGPLVTTTTTTMTTMTTTTSTSSSTTSTTLVSGPCAPAPQTGCVAAGKSVLGISTGSDPAKSKLKWKLTGGSIDVEQAAVGDPSASTTWTLCIYDSTLDLPFLAGSISAGPSASLWTSKDPAGWKYKDKTGSQDGVTGATLKTGPAGKPKVLWKGAGSNLPLPLPFDATSYFDQASTVTVQLVKHGGPGADLCWTSEFGAADTKLNGAGKFKATAR